MPKVIKYSHIKMFALFFLQNISPTCEKKKKKMNKDSFIPTSLGLY